MPPNQSDWSDEFEIRALVDRYCDAVNRRDVPLWLETWNEDPHWELFGRPTQGREAALGVLQGALAMLNFVVQTAVNPVIDVDGDRATGRWLVTEWSESEQLGRLMLLFIYHDEYERTAAGWRIASRRMQLLYQGPPDLSGQSFSPTAEAD
jgi:ketosteroid isomerase-like protein